MTMPSNFDAQLIANGYEPLAACGGAVFQKGWTSVEITIDWLASARAAHPDWSNTGMRTGKLVAIDIDIVDADHAEAHVQLAYKMLGPSPFRRFGSKGALLCYRNETPIRKLRARVHKDSSDKNGTQVEILGTGEMFVGFGIHHRTGKPIEWQPAPDGLVRSPLDLPLAELPEVTPAQIEAYRLAAIDLLTRQGYGLPKAEREPGAEREPTDREPVDYDDAVAVLKDIDPEMPEEDWFKLCAAISDTAFARNNIEDAGLAHQICLEWSQGDYWGTLNPKFDGRSESRIEALFSGSTYTGARATWGTVVHTARVARIDKGLDPHTGEPRRPASETFKDYFERDRENPSQGESTSEPYKYIFEFVSPKDFPNRPAPTWIIADVVQSRATHVGYGESGSGKTFDAIEICGAIVTGKAAHGKYEVLERGDVILFEAESPGDIMRKRWPAYCQNASIDDPFQDEFDGGYKFRISPRCPMVGQVEAEVKVMVKEIKQHGLRPKLVVIDTVERALSGLNENETKDMAFLLEAKDFLIREFGCSIWLIHHTPSSDKTKPRGANSLFSNADQAYHYSKLAADRTYIRTPKKAKSDEMGEPIKLQGKVYTIPDLVRHDGRPETSLAFTFAGEISTKENQEAAGVSASLLDNVVRKAFHEELLKINRVLVENRATWTPNPKINDDMPRSGLTIKQLSEYLAIVDHPSWRYEHNIEGNHDHPEHDNWKRAALGWKRKLEQNCGPGKNGFAGKYHRFARKGFLNGYGEKEVWIFNADPILTAELEGKKEAPSAEPVEAQNEDW